MHLVDGIVSTPLVVSSAIIAAGTVAVGLKRVDPDDVPKIALLSAAFFVASVIRVPIGPGAAHLMLTGLLGLILGPMIFPAVLAGLLLQTLMFGFGGISVLGLNLLNIALPGFLAFLMFSPLLHRCPSSQVIIWGALAGGFAVIGSSLMVAGSLALSGQGFWTVAKLIVLANLPVAVVEGLVVGAALSFLFKLKPGLFPRPKLTAKQAA